MKEYLLGLDIGGTKCACVIGDREGLVLRRREIATREHPDWEDMLALLCAAGEEMLQEMGASLLHTEALGVSCGGPLSSREGLILSPPNLPGWDDVPVTKWLTERTGLPAYLENDANACALAEYHRGAGKGCRSMVFLTFGTGMGAGLILDGRLYSGACDLAGEVGHIRLTEEGPEGFGKEGSLEGWCSGGGLAKLSLLRTGKSRSAKELAMAADAGDTQALALLEECGTMLGRGLSLLVDMLNPERIILGSIYARAHRHLEAPMRAVLSREALPKALAHCEILPAALGDSLGDVAALMVAKKGSAA